MSSVRKAPRSVTHEQAAVDSARATGAESPKLAVEELRTSVTAAAAAFVQLVKAKIGTPEHGKHLKFWQSSRRRADKAWTRLASMKGGAKRLLNRYDPELLGELSVAETERRYQEASVLSEDGAGFFGRNQDTQRMSAEDQASLPPLRNLVEQLTGRVSDLKRRLETLPGTALAALKRGRQAQRDALKEAWARRNGAQQQSAQAIKEAADLAALQKNRGGLY